MNNRGWNGDHMVRNISQTANFIRHCVIFNVPIIILENNKKNIVIV